mmetsp:Transcript_2004/g.5908  ORF Transcript_2004/g.5908 Transcript_2004/m.5908 type:complete len:431 (+) Transcript_2004:217-1509(+)|eukprot:CAMPEP_0117667186 /NCGR_PEP_ID=MMETSP0804-20121206/10813_1 /TAXON_ID=1074897 /ORGANISM="Tetraselmis astigmatica, Strain CCMP880" /LENGTH=430 /DNA_ID=CAMNT_0005474857 /DNA_START=171 /DNA_END=1463 /DNA_ORIENTATION=-
MAFKPGSSARTVRRGGQFDPANSASQTSNVSLKRKQSRRSLPPGLASFATCKNARAARALGHRSYCSADYSGRPRGPTPPNVFLSEAQPQASTAERELNSSVPSPTSISDIVEPVAADMEQMKANLMSIVGERHPMLRAAAEQIFGAGGKRLRPMAIFLIARATAHAMELSDITEEQRRLAEITEMIHTASLVHDDVLDDCSLRRGADTVNSLYGTRVAVLVGDFLFAQSSWFLANLDNLEVIKLISQVIADFANGEISQAASLFDTDISLEKYLDKSFYKTASLIAASCKSAAAFSGCDAEMKNAMFEYGRHLGLAFQVVDDILDFTQTEEQLGKPQGQDLASGNLTAPVLFALECSDELREIIDSEFEDDDSLQRALEIVHEVGGIDKSFSLARQEADKALASLRCLPDSPSKRSLELLVSYVLDRLY